jgi:hypothetical protein
MGFICITAFSEGKRKVNNVKEISHGFLYDVCNTKHTEISTCNFNAMLYS